MAFSRYFMGDAVTFIGNPPSGGRVLALRRGVKRIEVQLPAGQGSKLFEVTKVVTKTGHINLITGLVALSLLPGMLWLVKRVGSEGIDSGSAATIPAAVKAAEPWAPRWAAGGRRRACRSRAAAAGTGGKRR